MSEYNSNYSLYLPSYSIGPNCYKEIPYVTRFFGKTAAVIGGKTAIAKAKSALIEGVKGSLRHCRLAADDCGSLAEETCNIRYLLVAIGAD